MALNQKKTQKFYEGGPEGAEISVMFLVLQKRANRFSEVQTSSSTTKKAAT